MTVAPGAYAEDHWSQAAPTKDAVARYVADNQKAYNRTKSQVLLRLLGDLEHTDVLDYGGGGGYLATRCARRGARVTLVDREPGALELARELARSVGVEDRITRIHSPAFPSELRQRRFPAILAKDIIEHIPEDEALLHEFAAVQRPGDRLLISTQSSWSLNYLLEGTYRRWWCGERDWCGWDPTHVRFYTPRSLGRRLIRAGYRPRRWHGVFIVPYNLLSWLVLLKRDLTISGLHKLDLWLGGGFPFNRLGWNVLVLAERAAQVRG